MKTQVQRLTWGGEQHKQTEGSEEKEEEQPMRVPPVAPPIFTLHRASTTCCTLLFCRGAVPPPYSYSLFRASSLFYLTLTTFFLRNLIFLYWRDLPNEKKTKKTDRCLREDWPSPFALNWDHRSCDGPKTGNHRRAHPALPKTGKRQYHHQT